MPPFLLQNCFQIVSYRFFNFQNFLSYPIIYYLILINTFKYHIFAPMGRFQIWPRPSNKQKFKILKKLITIIYDLNSNCQLSKTGDRSNSTHTRPVDNVVITTKGLQDRNNYCLMERRWKIKVN